MEHDYLVGTTNPRLSSSRDRRTDADGAARAADAWARSGAAALTDAAVDVPVRMVETVLDLVAELDRRGAGLATLVAADGVGLLAERAAFLGLGPSSTASCGGATRFLRASDGWVALSLARPDDIELLPAWLKGDVSIPGHPFDPRPDGFRVPAPLWDELDRTVEDWSGSELVERAALLGLACTTPGESLSEHAVRADRLGDTPGSGVAGAVIVDLSSLWAGPLATDVLSRIGARVIKVESIARPDGARATPAFFAALHGRSESVAFDHRTAAGRSMLQQLISRADVVVEASRPRALRQLGIDATTLLTGTSGGGPKVWLSITAHGRNGPGANRVGYGDDAAVAGGLLGWVGGEPRFLADAIADPLTGLVAALAVAEHLERGGRWILDVSLAAVARSMSDPVGLATAPRPEAPAPPSIRNDPGRTLPLGRDMKRILRGLRDGT